MTTAATPSPESASGVEDTESRRWTSRPKSRRAPVRALQGIGFTILVGLLIAAFVAWTAAQVERVDVVVASRDVPSGAVLTADDVEERQIAAGDAVSSIEVREDAESDDGSAVADADELLGATATAALVEGQLLTAASTTDRPLVGEGEALVFLDIPTAVANAGLATDQRVNVIEIPDATQVDEAEPVVLASDAEVVGVLVEDRTAIVTVRVPAGVSTDVQAASQLGRIALVRVAD